MQDTEPFEDFLPIKEGLFLARKASQLDLSSAMIDRSLQGAGYHPAAATFWGSLDYFHADTLPAVVAKILAAHGFVLNHENLLACIDSLGAGILTMESIAPIRRYFPVLYFQMPKSNSQGVLLSSYYRELQVLLNRESTKTDDETSKSKAAKDASSSQLMQQIDYLALKNSQLQKELTERESYLQSGKVQSGESSLYDVHLGKIKEIEAKSRTIKVKTGHKTVQFSFDELNIIPPIGHPCAVVTDSQERPHKILFFNFPGAVPLAEYTFGKILAYQGNLVKIRESNGTLWQILLRNPDRKPQKGADVILSKQGDLPLKLYVPRTSKSRDFLQKYTEWHLLAGQDDEDVANNDTDFSFNQSDKQAG
jgi:hypothetical protein